MILNIPTFSFKVYKGGSRYSLKRRHSLNILAAFFTCIIAVLFVFVGVKLQDYIGGIYFIVWLLFILFGAVLVLILLVFNQLIHGKIYNSGLVTFSPEGVELFAEVNLFLPYSSITYLSAKYERPESIWSKNPPAKTYLVDIITIKEEHYKLIVDRISEQPLAQQDLIDVLEFIRRQDHSIYKAFRGVKREFGDI